MYSFHSENKISGVAPEEVARLLRNIGASGRLVGFHYTVYIVYHILQKTDEYFWITKCAYPETHGISRSARPPWSTRSAR